MMLTSDLALLHDAGFRPWVSVYALDLAELDKAFSHAWYKLMTRDLGPYARCVGPWVPPPQPFQYPLPPPTKRLADFHAVYKSLLQTPPLHDGAAAAQACSTAKRTRRRSVGHCRI